MNVPLGIQRARNAPVRARHTPLLEVAMPHGMNGWMGGYGLAPLIGVLLVVFLIVAIVRMQQKK
ncbi:MAG: hypothetical protein ACYC3F_07585 [Gemmatimonadaceae bacterium]